MSGPVQQGQWRTVGRAGGLRERIAPALPCRTQRRGGASMPGSLRRAAGDQRRLEAVGGTAFAQCGNRVVLPVRGARALRAFLFDVDHFAHARHVAIPADHASAWHRAEGSEYEALSRKLEGRKGDELFVCIVSFHEMLNGWNAYMANRRPSEYLVRART